MMFRKSLAFIWQDWVQAKSYRASFLFRQLSMMLPLAALFLLGRVFNDVHVPAVDDYGGSYLPFSFVGIVLTTYSFTALRSFSRGLRRSQVTGTLEVLLLTRASLPTIILGWSLYPFLRATLQFLVYMAAGFLILGLSLEGANLAGAALALFLTVVIMGGLGILAASFTLVFKQGDPFTGLIVAASGFLGGTVYPVSVLPEWLQVVGKVVPQTHAIEAMRLAMLQNYSIADLLPHLVPLVGFALVVPLALWGFSLAMYRAKVEGSLAHY